MGHPQSRPRTPHIPFPTHGGPCFAKSCGLLSEVITASTRAFLAWSQYPRRRQNTFAPISPTTEQLWSICQMTPGKRPLRSGMELTGTFWLICGPPRKGEVTWYSKAESWIPNQALGSQSIWFTCRSSPQVRTVPGWRSIKCCFNIFTMARYIKYIERNIFVAWAPILVLIIMSVIPQSYWCSPINQGGKELVCGYDYARPFVQFLDDVLIAFGVCGFLASVWLISQRRLSRLGVVGFVLSMFLVIAFLILKAHYGAEDSP
jgi:hypothetical protein